MSCYSFLVYCILYSFVFQKNYEVKELLFFIFIKNCASFGGSVGGETRPTLTINS